MGETDGRFCLLSHGLYVEWKYNAEWFKSHVCAIVHIEVLTTPPCSRAAVGKKIVKNSFKKHLARLFIF